MPASRHSEPRHLPLRPARAVRLLDVDPDLGGGLAADSLEAATRHLVLPAVTLPVGPWTLEQLQRTPGLSGDVRGVLLLRGAGVVMVSLAGRECARLLTAGDLVLLSGPDPVSLPVAWSASVVAETRLVIFDDRLAQVARWPEVLFAVLARAALQTRHTLLQQAISQLPRAEARLHALFWSMADRAGVVRGEEIFIPLSFTQEMLARMIGAQRSTVSLALTALAEEGLLRLVPGGWMLARRSSERFELLDRAAAYARPGAYLVNHP